MATCHVVCAAPALDASTLALQEGDLLIAADGGYAACLRAGFEPELLLGDFDSIEGGEEGVLAESARCDRIVLPCAKDDTDTLAALREGLARGYKSFAIHNALGGDMGHAMANVHCLEWLHEQGTSGILYGAGQAAILVHPEDGQLGLKEAAPQIELPVKTRVSVFAFGGTATGVQLKGLRWELEDAQLAPQDSIGVSNEVASDDPKVAVGEGALLIILG